MKIRNPQVIIIGLGLHGGGVSSAIFFAQLGWRVLVTDLKNKKELKSSLEKLHKFKNIEYILGKHRKDDFKKANLIIRNPAVPNNSEFLNIARQNKIPVHTDVSWFLSQLPIRNCQLPIIIGITGTKGKSTTAALLNYVFSKCGKKSLVAGNIKKSPLDFIKIKNCELRIANCEFLILELSSWQLESFNEHKLSPNIALITNILPDHLNRYKNFTDYQQAKSFIFKHQNNKDILFLNQKDSNSRQIAKKQKIKTRMIWYNQYDKDAKKDSIHRVFLNSTIHSDNIQAVLAISKYLKLNKKLVQQAIKTFSGLEGRLELVDTIYEVQYYNDTCATQPEATIYAINKLKTQSSKRKDIKQRPKTRTGIVLITGGEDKNLEYRELAQVISKNIKTLILFKGSASQKIIKSLKEVLRHKNTCPVEQSDNGIKTLKQKRTLISQYYNIFSMKQALSIAKKEAKSGDIVLLSPAAASFGLFKNEFDRGEQFKKMISFFRKLKNQKT